MKKVLTLTLALLAALSLTAVAHADVIASPAAVAGYYAIHYLPCLLVGAVVVLTVCLLRKFWKKKK